MELEELRARIAALDAQSAALFAERMALSARIGAYKQANGLPICDPAQEKRVLAGGCAQIEDAALRPYYNTLLRQTMALSRRWQARQTSASEDSVLSMALGPDSYDILVRRGSLFQAGALLPLERKVLLVSDEGVPQRYVDAVAAGCREAVRVVLPQGEASKSPANLERLWRTMLAQGFTREDCVCAVGGGVVGDLAGFAAATYERGIDCVLVPTTLLAQVDSAIGGKTAVDLDGYKNAVGAFRQPKAVLIDPDTLQTLPPPQLSSGMAEVIKAGLIADAALFARIEAGPCAMEELILPALRVKQAVVEADEREQDLRRCLNFGHTLGHAIERVTGLLHGACVGLGMLPMCSPPVRERLLPVLRRLGLPTEIRADPDAVFEAVLHDKKRSGDTVCAVYVETPGSFVLRQTQLSALREGIELVVKR